MCPPLMNTFTLKRTKVWNVSSYNKGDWPNGDRLVHVWSSDSVKYRSCFNWIKSTLKYLFCFTWIKRLWSTYSVLLELRVLWSTNSVLNLTPRLNLSMWNPNTHWVKTWFNLLCVSHSFLGPLTICDGPLFLVLMPIFRSKNITIVQHIQ